MTATALSGGLLAGLLIATPALAQQGGAGGSGGFEAGGNGGGVGQDGGPSGYPVQQTPGGAGGATPGAAGGDGGSNVDLRGGGGGGGGADGDMATPIGGNGGAGGNGGNYGQSSVGGGGGGAGGNGLILAGAVTNAAVIRGGDGGRGGTAGNYVQLYDGPANGGSGGEGGAGILAGTGAAIVNDPTGSISGGNGGTGGGGSQTPGVGAAGADGAGGEGIRGAGFNIQNAGSISGGLGGDGVSRAYALHFTGSANTLGLLAGGSITGGIQIDTGAVLAFEVNGAETLDNVISGDGSIAKTGTGTLTLTGANTYTGSTILNDGTLQIGDVSNISSGTIALNAGTLRTTFDGTLGNALSWDSGGTGSIAAATGTTLTLTGPINAFGSAAVSFGNAADAGTVVLGGAQSYSAITVVNGGTLQLDDLASFGSSALVLNAGTLRTTADGSLAGNLYWDNGATGAIAAATGKELTLTGSFNFFGTTAQFGTATDNGTIVAALSGASGGGISGRLVIGGGTFRAAGVGTMNLAIGSMETVQIDAGATLDLNAGQPTTTINSLEGAGTLLNDGAITIINSGDFAGTITGTQNIVKNSGATLILSGDNDYGGTTLVNDGVLQIGAGGTSGTLGTDNVTVATGATLAFARSDDVTVSNAIDGDGSVEQAGPGILTLTGANTYTGGTIITGGLINFTGLGNFGSGSIVMDGGGLQWGAAPTTDISTRVSGIGSGGAVFDTNGFDVTLANTLSGSGGLTKLGGGTLTLSGSNSFGGPVTIIDGTLLQGSEDALGGASIILGGGTLDLDTYNLTIGQARSITGSGTIQAAFGFGLATTPGEETVFGSAGGVIDSNLGITITGGSTLTMLGNNLLSGGIVVGGKLVIGETGAAGGIDNVIATIGSVISYADGVDNAATVIIASNTTQLEVLGTDIATQSGGIVQDASVRGFEKIGGGTLNMTGANAYTGTTLVTGGTLAFNDQAIRNSTAITIDNGAAIRLLEDINYSGALTIQANGGTIDTGIYSLYQAEHVDFLGELTKTGSGRLTIGDNLNLNTGAGGINVLEGTLALATDPAAGTGTIKLADNTTLLNVNVSCGCTPLQVANAIQIALGGTATIDSNGYDTVLAGNLTGGNLLFTDTFGGGTITLTGANSYGDTTVSDSVTLVVGDGTNNGTLGTGTITSHGMLAFDRSDEVTLTTAVGGNGQLGQFGTGTLILTVDNNYAGGTTILNPDGTIQVGTGGTTGSLGTGAIVLAGSLIFNRSDDVVIDDDIIGDGTITKLGAGTLSITGDNIFSGAFVGKVSVQGGTLAVSEFGLGAAQLVELYGGTTLKALENSYAGDVAILSGGATIDTGAFDFDIIGAANFQGELTKTGSGTLYLDDVNDEGDGAGGINVTAGRLGLGGDYAAGTGILKFADGTTLLNAACNCVSGIDVDNDIQIAAGGTLTIDGDGFDTYLNGAISGGNLVFTAGTSPGAASRFMLYGANSFGTALIGPNVALIVREGTLGTGDVTFDPTPSDPFSPAALVFQNDADVTFGGRIVGSGVLAIEADPDATVNLTGSNTAAQNFTGTIEYLSGRLAINGDFGDVVGNTTTLLIDDSCFCGGNPAGTLGGSGTFHGNVELRVATLSPGNSPGTLTIAGNLALGAGTILNYELGAPGTVGGASNDLVNVGGNLRLDGTLNTIAAGAGYGPGYYRLFNYGGVLDNQGLDIGTIDGTGGALGATVLTNINGQVNLYLGGAQVVQYWDGGDLTGASATSGGNGGAGTWNDTPTNWTVPPGYSINDAWQNQVGVFAGAAGGIVTVMNEQAFEELRFETDGYQLRPANGAAQLTTVGAGFSILDVSAGVTADIGVGIQGAAGIDKAGDGTLILSAVNSYTGDTDVAAGTLVLTATGWIAGAVNNNATFTNAGTVTGLVTNTAAMTSTGTLDGGLDNSGTASFSGALNGAVANSGTIDLTGTTTGIGAVTQAGGIFRLNGFNASFGSLAGTGTVALGSALLTVGGDDTSTSFDGTITGSGGVTKTGTGTLTLSIAQGYTGLTTVAAGGLTLSATGSLAGAVHNQSTFTNAGTVSGQVDNDGTLSSTGTLAGGLVNDGTASLQGTISSIVNHGTVNFTGAATVTTVQQTVIGVFNLGGFGVSVGAFDGEGGIGLGGGTLTVGTGNASSSFAGYFTGNGTMTKTGTGTFTLAGASTNAATFDVAAGTLRLGIDNAIHYQSALNVQAGATFDLAGFRTSVDAFTGAGDVTLNNGRLDVGQNNASSSFDGTVTGTGGTSTFTKNGSGTLTLSGSIAVGSNPTLDAFVQNNGGGSIVITGTGSLGADLIQNFGTIENSGTINAGVLIQSFGTLTNTSTGTITGSTQNFATFDNYGTMESLQSLSGTSVNHSTGVINGPVQTFASFTSTGIINGGLSNFATALIENQVNGELANLQNGATVTLTGATTGITNYNSAQGSLLDLAGFNTTVGALNGAGGDIQLNGATLTVDNSVIASSDSTASIIGNGALIKTGTGEQILRGVSSYTGATSVNAGRLVLADTGALTSDVTIASGATFANNGTVTGLVTNDGAFTLTGALNPTGLVALVNQVGGAAVANGQINGRVQNAGNFTVNGSLTGITIFSQSATGQLELGADFGVDALSGFGTADLGSFTLSVGAGGASSMFQGNISGTSGGLTKTGSGVFTLDGTNTYTGATRVDGGTLILGSSGTITGGVINNARFESAGAVYGGLTNNGGAVILRGVVDGLVQNQGIGLFTLSGDATGNGRFDQESGATFDLNDYNASFGALSGSGKIDLGSGRLTVGSDNTSQSFAGTIFGTGGLTKTGEGTLTLTGVSTYDGPTFVNDGMLQLAEGGAIGGGPVANNAFLGFDGTTDRTFANEIFGGIGVVVKTGTHVLTLSGPNSYGGGTTVSEGTVAFTGNQSLGSGTVRLASATELRNANGGTALTLANDIEIAAGTLATLSGVDGSSTTLNGTIIDGNARFAVSGAGTAAFTLTGANSYEHTQIGAGASLTLADNGTLGAGNTLLESATAGLVFANAGDYTYGGQIAGNGTVLVDTLGAAVTLTGSNFAGNDFTGEVTVSSGKLVLNGEFGDITGNTANMVINGGALGGGGTFHGNVTVTSGTLAPGNSPGTLNIAGNLMLGAGTILNYELGDPGVVGGGVSDLVNVGGNLTLDGTLNVTALPTFGEGYYRLFNYGGTLTDNGLNFGAMPGGYTPSLLTNIGGQVNLLFSSSPQAIQYWDGGDLTGASSAVGGDGGAGIWNGANTNWTAPTGYAVNDSWRGQVAVFGGAAGGTVTVEGSQAFQELRFRTAGYVINGAGAADGLATTGGFSVVDVADGADATINAGISGNGGLTKTGDGTLSLGGANSYTGVTTVSAGELVVLAGGSLAGGVVNDVYFENNGTVAGQVVNNSVMVSTGTLNGGLDNRGTASISGVLSGDVLNATSGAITLTGTTTGIGAVTQTGNGSFDLNGFDTAFGSLAGSGTVSLGSAVLTLGGSNASTSFAGVISGSGGLTKIGTGTFTLTGANAYTGLTTVSAGTLLLSATGSLAGDVRNDAIFNSAGSVAGSVTSSGAITNTGTIAGLLTNSGMLTSNGTLAGGLDNSGTVLIGGTLNGAVTNSGTIELGGAISGIGAVTQAAGGTFNLDGFSTSFASLAGAGTVDLGNALLTLGGGNASTSFGGSITGSGGLTKTGTGAFTLTGTSDYTGLTTVSAGTLALSATGSLAGDVRNDAMFTNAGTVGGAVLNNATFNNAGTVTGMVQNDGTLTSTGTLAGGLLNNDTAALRGTVGTGIVNNGAVTLTGLTTTAALQQAASGSFDLAGFTASIGVLSGSGSITLGNGALGITGNTNSSFAGVISGTGPLTKTGTGTLLLTGANTYTGNTQVSAGTLALSATGALAGNVRNDATFNNAGTVSGSVTNNGTLTNTGTLAALVTNGGTLISNGTLAGGLDNSVSATIGGTLNGAVTNSGTIELGGATTGIGAVTQTIGTFRLNGFDTSFGSLAGAGTVELGGALLTLGGDNSSTSFAGAIAGSGGLTKTGTGIFTLAGANSYTGLTTVAAGTLVLDATGSLAGDVLNQASFTNAGTVAGMVQNDGTLASTGTLTGGLLNNGTASIQGQTGTGIVNNGALSFTAATTVTALQQAAAGSTNLAGFGVSIGTLTGAGAIALGSGTLGVGAGNGNSSFAGVISGSGGLAKTGTGTLVLTGANSFTGTTTITGGTLQIGNGGTTGSLAGAIANNGVLVLSRSDAVTFANAMSGTGGFVQAGTGTTTLTGANSYTGGTLVSAGRLRGDAGSLQGAIRIDTALEFAQTGAGTYAGSLLGAGLFEKSGTGTLNMTGDSSTFTGATHVLAGRLAVNGLLTRSVVTVSNGATLGGTGTVGGVVVQSGGTLAPGNSVGTFNVAGNVLFQAGSLFAVEVSSAGADRVQATGTAQLNGTLQFLNLGGNYAINATFVVLHADAGVSGTFANVDFASFGLAYRPKLIYSANEVQLLLAPNQLSAVLGTGVPLTYNQQSTIGRIDSAVLAGYDPSALASLYNLAPAAIPAALDSFSGEIYADATRASLEDERVVREAVIGRLAEAADTGLSGNGAWGQVIGSWGSVDGDGNAAGYDVDRTGMLMGMDAGAETDTGSWRGGVMGHYTRITVPATGRSSRATLDRTGGGFYAGVATGGWRIRAGASVSLLDLKAKREINIAGITGTARAKSRGTMLQTFAEISYRIEAGGQSFVEPYLAGSASRVQFGRFAETSGPVPLIVAAQKNVLGVGELGLRGEAALGGSKSGIRLGGNIGVRGAFGDRTANPVVALAAMPAQGLNIHSAEIDRFAAVANLNLSVDVSEQVSLRIGYSGVQGAGMREHGGRATLSLRF